MSETACQLQPLLASLQKQHADNYDRPRFTHIQTLLTKAQTAKDSVAQIIKQKAEADLSRYRDDFNRALSKANETAEKIITQSPSSENQVQTLLTNCDFKKITLLHYKLTQQQKPSPLAELNHYINQEATNNTTKQHATSFSDVLSQIEKAAIKNYRRPTTSTATKDNVKSNNLKAFDNFKQFKEKYDTDKLVEQIITLRPENLGPLNPHMLLIKSLESMRDLSPQYLSRFVTYIDTLLRLEDANNARPVTRARK